MDCGLRVASLTWSPSLSAQSYMVTAVASSGHLVALTTNDTSAQISELQCGLQYSLTVRAVNHWCKSALSNTSFLQTGDETQARTTGRVLTRTAHDNAPLDACSHVQHTITCFSSIAVVSWSGSDTADHYTATAVGPNDETQMCMSSGMSCGIATLQCGMTYLVTVTASNHLCSSVASQMTNLTTGHLDRAAAHGAQLHTHTSFRNSFCGLLGVSHSLAVPLPPVPCIPTGVSVTRSCDRNEALVSWGPSQGALSYRALAQSRKNDTSSCESAGNVTSCVLRNLSCSTVYTVKVVSVGDQCSSLLSAASVFSTGVGRHERSSRMHNAVLADVFTSCLCLQSVPCKVTIGSVYLNCSTDSLLLNWTATAASVVYTAVARATSGQVSSCSTNFTSCEITQLACGQAHNVAALQVASGSAANCARIVCVHFNPLSPFYLSFLPLSFSAPCHPVNVLSNINCSTQTAHVQWLSDGGVESYQVHVVGTRGHMAGCNTTRTSCDVHNLLCGDVYNVSVIATSNVCSVTKNAAAQLSSGWSHTHSDSSFHLLG
uniref:Fibronectin type-III domain-containing protein n=1 Tax=Electrophorus electricus TaxID=8005 RepID=A0AAY5EDR8_ELEEL